MASLTTVNSNGQNSGVNQSSRSGNGSPQVDFKNSRSNLSPKLMNFLNNDNPIQASEIINSTIQRDSNSAEEITVSKIANPASGEPLSYDDFNGSETFSGLAATRQEVNSLIHELTGYLQEVPSDPAARELLSLLTQTADDQGINQVDAVSASSISSLSSGISATPSAGDNTVAFAAY